jgi:hypothetical protein
MAESKKPTEKTPKGFEVPVPKRGEFFKNLKKIAKPNEPSTTRRPKQ